MLMFDGYHFFENGLIIHVFLEIIRDRTMKKNSNLENLVGSH